MKVCLSKWEVWRSQNPSREWVLSLPITSQKKYKLFIFPIYLHFPPQMTTILVLVFSIFSASHHIGDISGWSSQLQAQDVTISRKNGHHSSQRPWSETRTPSSILSVGGQTLSHSGREIQLKTWRNASRRNLTISPNQETKQDTQLQ